jgi:hypothetical protein
MSTAMKITTRRLRDDERNAALDHIRYHKAKGTSCRGVKIGDRRQYRGLPYTVYDFDAEGDGATVVLISDKYDIVRGVPFDTLFPTTL